MLQEQPYRRVHGSGLLGIRRNGDRRRWQLCDPRRERMHRPVLLGIRCRRQQRRWQLRLPNPVLRCTGPEHLHGHAGHHPFYPGWQCHPRRECGHPHFAHADRPEWLTGLHLPPAGRHRWPRRRILQCDGHGRFRLHQQRNATPHHVLAVLRLWGKRPRRRWHLRRWRQLLRPPSHQFRRPRQRGLHRRYCGRLHGSSRSQLQPQCKQTTHRTPDFNRVQPHLRPLLVPASCDEPNLSSGLVLSSLSRGRVLRFTSR